MKLKALPALCAIPLLNAMAYADVAMPSVRPYPERRISSNISDLLKVITVFSLITLVPISIFLVILGAVKMVNSKKLEGENGIKAKKTGVTLLTIGIVLFVIFLFILSANILFSVLN